MQAWGLEPRADADAVAATGPRRNWRANCPGKKFRQDTVHGSCQK